MSPVTESSNLVKLIKSLKQGEKRHITLELSRYKKENNLLKLYQLIANSNSVSDSGIRKKIKDKNFISQLSLNKHKLYIAILEALQTLHLNGSPYLQVLSMIHQSYGLYTKGLTKAKRDLLLKAINITRKYELRELELQILNLLQRTGYRFMDKNLDLHSQICEQLLKERKLNQLHNQILAFENDAGNRLNSPQKTNLKKLINTALSIKNESFTANYYRLRICFSFHAITGDHLHSYGYAQDLIQLFKRYPFMLELEVWRIEYIESLRNFIPSFTHFGKPKLRDFIYNEGKRMEVPDLYKASITVNILDSFIQSGEFIENEKKINDIQSHITYYQEYLSPYNKPVLYFNLAVLNFGLKKNSKALLWLNEIINNIENNNINTALAIVSRLLRLIVFYELGHEEIIENHIRSTARFIAKQESPYLFDPFLLKLIKNMSTLPNKKDLPEMMRQKKQELVLLLKDKTELRLLDYFDFISWIDSKIEQKSFVDIVKQKNNLRLKKMKLTQG